MMQQMMTSLIMGQCRKARLSFRTLQTLFWSKRSSVSKDPKATNAPYCKDNRVPESIITLLKLAWFRWSTQHPHWKKLSQLLRTQAKFLTLKILAIEEVCLQSLNNGLAHLQTMNCEMLGEQPLLRERRSPWISSIGSAMTGSTELQRDNRSCFTLAMEVTKLLRINLAMLLLWREAWLLFSETTLACKKTLSTSNLFSAMIVHRCLPLCISSVRTILSDHESAQTTLWEGSRSQVQVRIKTKLGTKSRLRNWTPRVSFKMFTKTVWSTKTRWGVVLVINLSSLNLEAKTRPNILNFNQIPSIETQNDRSKNQDCKDLNKTGDH